MTETLSVETLQTELAGVGSPPAEISSLVDDTLTAAKLLKKAQALQTEYCVTTPSRALCQESTDTWVEAETEVQRELAAWKPYGG